MMWLLMFLLQRASTDCGVNIFVGVVFFRRLVRPSVRLSVSLSICMSNMSAYGRKQFRM